jgi:uncharacterized membrane protein
MIRAAAAVVAALGCWALAHHTSDQRYWITDTGVYQHYGDAIAKGSVPYRDFHLEYPPASLPVFVLPSLGHERHRRAYDRWFDREMALCWCLVAVGVALLSRGPIPIALVAATPVLLGPVILSRFDAWPAALAVLALAAFVRRRLAIAAVLLGVAIAAKLWPAVLLPLAVIELGRRRGAAFAAGVIGVALAIFAPFLVIAPGGLWYSFHRQFARPLQIESLGSAVLVALHYLFGLRVGLQSTFGSQNLLSPPAHAVATATTVVGVLALLFVWWRARDVVVGSAAAVAAFIAFGKVLSPQFMVWIVPFAAVIPDVAVWILLVAALLLTQTWFPRHYWNLSRGLYEQESLEVLLRDLVVVALFAVTAWRSRTAPAPPSARQSLPD